VPALRRPHAARRGVIRPQHGEASASMIRSCPSLARSSGTFTQVKMFLPTVSVAVREQGHESSRGHGQIADSVAALTDMRRHLCRSEPCGSAGRRGL
jgi:hypothetical protein